MKILYVATVVKTHIMEFHIPYLKMFKDMGYETAVAARNDYENPADCIIPYCDKYYDIPFERSPFKLKNIRAYKQLKKVIDEGNYDVIHCHTPVGAALTRLAAQDARRKGTKIFYTAHGFHFCKGVPLINWLLYYPAERWLAGKTDVLITITPEDYERAKSFKAGRVEYIPGVGIDLKRFRKGNKAKVVSLKEQLGIPKNATVLLSVGEITYRKNHKIVIKALPSFPGVYYVLCGRGPLTDKHRKLSEELGVSERVIMTGYRNDVIDFYEMADIFVFPSFREGLPVALMEAMAMEVLCVASRNRGTRVLLKDSEFLFDPDNVFELKDKLHKAMNSDCSDEVKRNKEHVKNFDIQKVLVLVKKLFLDNVNKT